MFADVPWSISSELFFFSFSSPSRRPELSAPVFCFCFFFVEVFGVEGVSLGFPIQIKRQQGLELCPLMRSGRVGCGGCGKSASESALKIAKKIFVSAGAGGSGLLSIAGHGRRDGTKGALFRQLVSFPRSSANIRPERRAGSIAPRLERSNREAKGGRRGA